MDDNTKKREKVAGLAKKGFIFLTSRTLLTNILQLFSSLALARFLKPVDYSIFGVLNGLVNSLSFFTDIGMHEVLVQQKSEIKDEQIRTYLSFRLFVSVVLSLLFAVAFYFLKDYYEIKESNILFYFLGLFTILEVLSTIPTIFFQKRLEFAKLAKVELVGTVLLYVAQISFAYLGFEYWCFFFGIFIRYIVMIIFGIKNKFYIMPKFSSVINIKKYMKVGVFFQLNLMLTATHAILIPIILKYFLSLETIGLFFWISGLVSIPNSFIANFNHTLFPAISKVQSSIDDIKILINKASELILFIIVFIFGLGASIGPSIITIVFDEKWYEARDYLPLVALGIGLFNIRNIGNTLLAGIGQPNKRTGVEVFNLMSLVSLTCILGYFYKLEGYLWAIIISNFLSIIFLSVRTHKYMGIKIYKRFSVLFVSGFLGFYCVRYYQLEQNLIYSFLSFVCVFSLSSAVIDKNIFLEIIEQYKKMRKR